MQYTTTDFIAAINRELSLRRTTYPKIVAKKQKQWTDQGEDVMALSIELSTTQRIQYELINHCGIHVEQDVVLAKDVMVAIFRELQRELRMRKSCYPRWVRWERMTHETAAMETAVWSALTKYYHETYCPEAPWRKPPTKRHA